MEDVVNVPGDGELDLIRHRGDLFDYFERSVSFWGQFGFLMAGLEVGCF